LFCHGIRRRRPDAARCPAAPQGRPTHPPVRARLLSTCECLTTFIPVITVPRRPRAPRLYPPIVPRSCPAPPPLTVPKRPRPPAPKQQPARFTARLPPRKQAPQPVRRGQDRRGTNEGRRCPDKKARQPDRAGPAPTPYRPVANPPPTYFRRPLSKTFLPSPELHLMKDKPHEQRASS